MHVPHDAGSGALKFINQRRNLLTDESTTRSFDACRARVRPPTDWGWLPYWRVLLCVLFSNTATSSDESWERVVSALQSLT